LYDGSAHTFVQWVDARASRTITISSGIGCVFQRNRVIAATMEEES
jgi:hypothetical protein